jgi:hypothetical protein
MSDEEREGLARTFLTGVNVLIWCIVLAEALMCGLFW